MKDWRWHQDTKIYYIYEHGCFRTTWSELPIYSSISLSLSFFCFFLKPPVAASRNHSLCQNCHIVQDGGSTGGDGEQVVRPRVGHQCRARDRRQGFAIICAGTKRSAVKKQQKDGLVTWLQEHIEGTAVDESGRDKETQLIQTSCLFSRAEAKPQPHKKTNKQTNKQTNETKQNNAKQDKTRTTMNVAVRSDPTKKSHCLSDAWDRFFLRLVSDRDRFSLRHPIITHRPWNSRGPQNTYRPTYVRLTYNGRRHWRTSKTFLTKQIKDKHRSVERGQERLPGGSADNSTEAPSCFFLIMLPAIRRWDGMEQQNKNECKNKAKRCLVIHFPSYPWAGCALELGCLPRTTAQCRALLWLPRCRSWPIGRSIRCEPAGSSRKDGNINSAGQRGQISVLCRHEVCRCQR